MSKDIRSFFSVVSKKATNNASSSAVAPKKKPQRLEDSDDDDIIASTPEASTKKRPIVVLSSDSEEEKPKPSKSKPKSTPKKEKPAKLKPANVTSVFKKTPIKQSEVKPVPKAVPVEKKPSKKDKKKPPELGIHNDPVFEKTLMALDDEDDFFEKNIDILEQSVNEALNSSVVEVDIPKKEENERKRPRNSTSDNTPKKRAKIEHTDSGIDPDQESHEKKRYSAMLYQKYLNRSGPKHLGSKELPKGKPDCLKNLCFLRTGVLDSLASEDFQQLITEHGGRIVQAVSKKVNYVVVGEEPGPAKLAKAEEYNIPSISEDELLDLILTKSGMEPKYTKKNTSFSSEDQGIDTDHAKSSEEFTVDSTPSTPKRLNNKITKIDTKEKLKASPKLKAKETTEKKKTSSKSEEKVTIVQKKNSPKKTVSEEIKKRPSEQKRTSAEKPKLKEPLKRPEINPSNLAWTEKYKPTDLSNVIGQGGAGSNLKKLLSWLENWPKNQQPSVRKNIKKPSPWAQSDDGAYYKCALLSGPPGIGKTTTAFLVAKELGLDVVEFNASDTRSKRLLHEEVSQLLSTNTIAGFASGQSKVNKHRVLLMDEVDGMAGNEDRGGMQELIQLIKNSNIPIICMCNDRNHEKIRSLVNYCYDLRFNKPKLLQIKGAMMGVCFKEHIKIDPKVLEEIILGTGCDIRQTLNHLSIYAVSGQNQSVEEAHKEAKTAQKDAVMGPWEVCRKVFTESDHRTMSISDQSRLFFFDYSLGPLFVQENYLQVAPKGNKGRAGNLLKAARAADAISMGDIISTKIRKSNNWSLLESQAMFSSVIPGYQMSGEFKGRINFPGWLGKNSKKNKLKRLITEVQSHTQIRTLASKVAVKLDYVIPLRDAILQPLINNGTDGVQEAIDVMKNYSLLREDLDSLVELGQSFNGKNPMSKIESKVKSAFTRAYNKQVTLLPFTLTTSKKKTANDENSLGDEEGAMSDDDDDINNDPMIKVGASTSKKKVGKKEESISKKTEPKKGKAKK